MHNKTNGLLLVLFSLGFAIISYLYKEGQVQVLLTSIGVISFFMALNHFLKSKDVKNDEYISQENIKTQITELALLNEKDVPISYWQMYGKASLVIGLDTGENNVDVNLFNTTYASTIDVEHAVLNYSGGNWYVEDNSSKNGISVIKSDGKKYRLNNEKPCLVEKGDILYISMAKLKLC